MMNKVLLLIALPVALISGTELVEVFDIFDDVDCDDTGEVCIDHEQCCGGCCYNGECIDTLRSCLTPFDVCRNHVCLGAESCVVYIPPQCRGCEPLPLCRIV